MSKKRKREYIDFITESEIYKPEDISVVARSSLCEDMLLKKYVQKSKTTIQYYNASCAFDIETTSFYSDDSGNTYTENNDMETRHKQVCMYVWQLGINGRVIVGRTWKEFIDCINNLCDLLHLNSDKRLIIYVHNLSYEFQFIRKWFTWLNVFATDSRKVVYCVSDLGIEFRDSYILANKSLAGVGNDLQKYHVQKLVGDLDYSLLRHSDTLLTEQELAYCVNDVRVVMAYIQEKIEQDGDILKIPLTNTGYVRKYCKNACYYIEGKSHKDYESINKYRKYRHLMNVLTISPEEYKQAKRCFQGGFTHCSALYSRKLLYNVSSYDFTSSYPYVMISEKFPMSAGWNVSPATFAEFENYMQNEKLAIMVDIRLHDVEPKYFYENYLSASKCRGVKGAILNNGRIVYADYLETSITDVDYRLLKHFYKWDKIEYANMRCYAKGYLPTNLVKAIVNLYKDKTTLKGVEGAEVDYLISKGMLNSTYGMSVTDIVRDIIKYTDRNIWNEIKVFSDDAIVAEQIDKYNKSKNRFLFYLWGIYVTAYARYNLFTGITEFKTDYVYSDTDSIKVLNAEAHKDYIDRYNNNVVKKLQLACKRHNIPFSSMEPETIKGEKKLIGVWDYEGTYTRFKSIGAKRYLVEKNGKLEMTVAGVNKKHALPYLLETYKSNTGVFNAFDDNLYIPPAHTGKQTHTYIDYEMQGILTDYKGVKHGYHELSGTHLEQASFNMSMTQAYIDYLKGVKHGQY